VMMTQALTQTAQDLILIVMVHQMEVQMVPVDRVAQEDQAVQVDQGVQVGQEDQVVQTIQMEDDQAD